MLKGLHRTKFCPKNRIPWMRSPDLYVSTLRNWRFVRMQNGNEESQLKSAVFNCCLSILQCKPSGLLELQVTPPVHVLKSEILPEVLSLRSGKCLCLHSLRFLLQSHNHSSKQPTCWQKKVVVGIKIAKFTREFDLLTTIENMIHFLVESAKWFLVKMEGSWTINGFPF